MNSIHKFVTGGMAALMMSAGAFALNPSGAFAATPEAPPVPGARKSPKDGLWYIPDPSRPGKYLRVDG